MNDIIDLKRKVALACNILANQGIVDFLGHVSCRLSNETLLISPSSIDLSEISEKDILLVNLRGEVIEGEHPAPSELPIHLSIYKLRRDVGSIVHAHPRFTTLFSIVKEPIVPVHHLGTPFLDGVAKFEDYSLVNDIAIADKLAEALGDKRAVLLKNHGVVVVGRSVEEACTFTIWLERNCELQLLSKFLGKVHAIPTEDNSRKLADHYLSKTVKSAWNYYVKRLRKLNEASFIVL